MFKDDYVQGKIPFEKLDDEVGLWHKGSSNLSLREYLGLSEEEYAVFLKGDSLLKQELDRQKAKFSAAGSVSQKIESHYKKLD